MESNSFFRYKLGVNCLSERPKIIECEQYVTGNKLDRAMTVNSP
jgi:hypothetical protein